MCCFETQKTLSGSTRPMNTGWVTQIPTAHKAQSRLISAKAKLTWANEALIPVLTPEEQQVCDASRYSSYLKPWKVLCFCWTFFFFLNAEPQLLLGTNSASQLWLTGRANNFILHQNNEQLHFPHFKDKLNRCFNKLRRQPCLSHIRKVSCTRLGCQEYI